MKFLRTTTLAVAAAFVVLTPTTAHAATATRYDATGDLMMTVYNPETEEETSSPAPTRKQGDITKVRTSFEGETIRVSASFRALLKTGPFIFHSLRLVTTKLQREVVVSSGTGLWAGEAEMIKYGRVVNCTGLTHTIDYTKYLVVVNVPRSCLAASGFKPGAVRVGWGTITSADENTIFSDDGFTSTPVDTSSALTLSPKVFRN